MLSIWHKSYRIRPRGALHERQEPDRPNLKGKEVLVRAQIKRSPHKRVREGKYLGYIVKIINTWKRAKMRMNILVSDNQLYKTDDPL